MSSNLLATLGPGKILQKPRDIFLDKLKTLVLDIEADGLKPSVIWVVCTDLDGVKNTFKKPTTQDTDKIQKLVDEADLVVMHNGIWYDAPQLQRLLNVHIPHEKIFDTLVVSKLINVNRVGGHSLESWGEQLKFPKRGHEDWTQFSEEMVLRCVDDVELTRRVFEEHMQVLRRTKGTFSLACVVEHDAALSCYEAYVNGFRFNIEECHKIRNELAARQKELEELILKDFPPREVIRVLKTKTVVDYIPFNPSSPKQVVERMWEFGWKPIDKTNSHLEAIKQGDKERIKKFEKTGWKVNETNLSTLPADCPPACSHLLENTIITSRIRTLDEWISHYNPTTGRIHAQIDALGTVTHRANHRAPNVGNIPTAKTIKFNQDNLRQLAIDLGSRLRSLWVCDDDATLVGTDMESAHLRIFGHLIDDKQYIQSLLTGDKKLGTDPHSLNKKIIGDVCVDRDRAKTFIFSFFNGAASPKVASIFGCTPKIAKKVLSTFIDSYPGLRNLKEKIIPRDAQRGYFVGVDGRYVLCDSEHLMIGRYLQNMESVLMKYACMIWRRRLKELGIKFKFVNWVHDEWVTEVYGDADQVKLVETIQCEAIKEAGERFKLNCPMAGESKHGKNWLVVH